MLFKVVLHVSLGTNAINFLLLVQILEDTYLSMFSY